MTKFLLVIELIIFSFIVVSCGSNAVSRYQKHMQQPLVKSFERSYGEYNAEGEINE